MRSTLIISLLLLAGACTRVPSRSQCEQLVDHLIKLELKESASTATPEAVKTELGKTHLDHCLKNLPLNRVECGLKATTLKQAEDCDN